MRVPEQSALNQLKQRGSLYIQAPSCFKAGRGTARKAACPARTGCYPAEQAL